MDKPADVDLVDASEGNSAGDEDAVLLIVRTVADAAAKAAPVIDAASAFRSHNR